MKQRNLWLIAVFLAILCGISVVYCMRRQEKDLFLMVNMALIMAFVAGSILAALFALIPRKGKPYFRKLEGAMPVGVSISLVFLTVCFIVARARLSDYEFEPGPVVSYEDAIPTSDCSMVRDGVFEDDGLILERVGDVQVQTFKKSQKKVIFKIKWTGECEYELEPPSRVFTAVKVKITKADEKGFSCVALSEGDYGREYTYKRK